ncbi:MAG: quinolinate synthase NadA [Alphaproteobacteria bacterium]
MNLPSNNQLIEEILSLKKQRNAVILAHFYQNEEIQDIADFVGDSLDLSRKASNTDADEIIFCGVKFMAEVAKILSPQKKVLIPDYKAGCSLEDSCKPEDFAKFRQRNPDAIAITYINCSAEIKALSDIIVTSSNAEKIISQIPSNQKIIFAPDQHLGRFIIKKTGRDMILWHGSCIVHEQFSERELIKLSVKNPHAKIIAHPECPEDLLKYAHHIGSTSSLLNYVKNNQGAEFIVLTEPHIIHQMIKVNPTAKFFDCPFLNSSGCNACNNCPYMQLNDLEKLYEVIKFENKSRFGGELILSETLRIQAQKPLKKMLEMS